MNSTKAERPKPAQRIEVWLTKGEFRITCKEVREDESVEEWKGDAVTSLSMRGAQREVTGYYLSQGYEPLDRWSDEEVDRNDQTLECSRHFEQKLTKTK